MNQDLRNLHLCVVISAYSKSFYMTSSCSFRITRTAEDLALTITEISQRLIKLEQRLEVLELQSNKPKESQSDEEMVMLDGVDQLLQECKGLLNKNSSNDEESEQMWIDENTNSDEIAA